MESLNVAFFEVPAALLTIPIMDLSLLKGQSGARINL